MGKAPTMLGSCAVLVQQDTAQHAHAVRLSRSDHFGERSTDALRIFGAVRKRRNIYDGSALDVLQCFPKSP